MYCLHRHLGVQNIINSFIGEKVCSDINITEFILLVSIILNLSHIIDNVINIIELFSISILVDH